ncbi:hypothetical protein Ndes2526B_g07286 [Nannochloris sp. 'desiccata']|nr:hypothetical protein KSW81_004693 [Chlorella desiccata (nom. nud.)]KAH7618350.1 putative Gem-associated protein 5 [Chlorella desiccata (nom. nud.)]
MGTVILPPSPNWYASHLADVGPGLHAYCAHNSIVVLNSGGTHVCDVLKGHSNRTTAVAFVHDEDDPTALWIVSASSDKNVRLWICTNIHQGTFSCRRSLGKRPAEVKAIAATSRVAIVGDTAGNLFIWNVATSPERMQRLEKCHQGSSVTCLACSPKPEHSVVAVGCANGEVAFIDWAQGVTLSVLRSHNVEVHCLRWSHLGIEDIETTSIEEEGEGEEQQQQQQQQQQQLPKCLELLVSAAPGERIKIYETRSIGGGACDFSINSTESGDTPSSPLGEGREIALVTTLQLPKPPGNLAQGQRHRLWLSADWLPAPAVRRQSRNGTIDVWMITSGYGGGLLARRVLLPCCGSNSNNYSSNSSRPAKIEAGEESPVRLPGGHSRTVFSVRCMLDLSREEPGVRILTIGMDRAALAWWAPVPRLHRNFMHLKAEEKSSSFSESAAVVGNMDAMRAAYEAGRTSWQRTELVGSITGLGSFPQALSISPRKLDIQVNSSISLPLMLPKLAMGCGDGSIRILSFQQSSHTSETENENTTTTTDDGLCVPFIPAIQLDTQVSTLIWQGIPAPVTTVLWHPSEGNILAFGCSDGSLGLVHCGKGTAIVAMTKHKAEISHIAWILSSNEIEEENKNVEKNTKDEEEKNEATLTKLKSNSKSYRLLTLSSDGLLFQWNSWPESSLADLFPGPVKQQQQHGAAVTPRTELGHPLPFLIPHLDSKGKGIYAPTCLGPGYISVDTVIGCVDGRIFRIEQGSCLENGSVAGQLEKQQQLGEENKHAAVTHVAVYEAFYASLHTDQTLQLADMSRSRLKVPISTKLAGAGGKRGKAEAASMVTSMALVSTESSTCHTSLALYAAVGLQDGTIQIWGCNLTPDAQQEEGRKEENENEKHENNISLVTLLRGHAGPVVSLEWIAFVSSLEHKKDTRVVLFSGSEDQSVRKWDLATVMRKQQGKREDQENALGAAEDRASGGLSNSVGNEEEEDNIPPTPPPLHEISEGIAQEHSTKSVAALPSPTAAKISSSSSNVKTTKSAGATATSASAITAATSLAAHQVSLGSKGLLPPSLPRAETLHDQASLDAVLLALTAQVAAADKTTGNHREESQSDYFSALGCIVDPLAAMPALRHASESLLSGSPQRPAAARVLAQRAAAVSLWAGDIGSAIKVLVENDALTADFVSFSAAAGRGAWEAASRAYAFLLEERGEPHLAVLHLTSIGDPVAACKVYTRAGMVREAASLAAAKLPPRHPLVLETRQVYASQLEGRGDFERAAAQYIASENWNEAVEMLQKRGTVRSLQTALEILSIVQLKKEESLLTFEQVEQLKHNIQNSLLIALKVENSSSVVLGDHSLHKQLSGLTLGSDSEQKIKTAATVKGKEEDSQRQRYSTEALEHINDEMMKNTEDALNTQFEVRLRRDFPNLSALLEK